MAGPAPQAGTQTMGSTPPTNFPPTSSTGGGGGGGGSAGAGGGGGSQSLPAGVTSVTRYRVYTLANNKKLGKPNAARAIFNFIWNHEIANGGTFISVPSENRAYLFEGDRRRLYEISPRNDRFTALLTTKYGLLGTEQMTRHVIAALYSYALENGIRREVRRFTYYDARHHILYISRYDGTCWRLDGYDVDTVPNGTGVLFADDDGGSSCLTPDIGHHRMLLPMLVDSLNYVERTQGGMSAEQQRLALTLWLFATAFADRMPTKPILLVEGAKGSGKTVALQLIQYALHGTKFPMQLTKSGEEDFGIQILRSPIAIIDNADTYVDWLPDALCAYATGGGWRRRKKYTDTDQIEIRPQSFIAISSRNPITFRRDDVADRCMILRLERRSNNVPTDILFEKIRVEREKLYGEWLWYLNEIVYAIAHGAGKDYSGEHRMADFARMGYTIGIAFGLNPDLVDETLNALQHEREVLANEGDPLIDLIDKWLENQRNRGREVTSKELHADLVGIARSRGQQFYKSASALAQRLRDTVLGRHFHVRRRKGHAGYLFYSFRPVPAGEEGSYIEVSDSGSPEDPGIDDGDDGGPTGEPIPEGMLINT